MTETDLEKLLKNEIPISNQMGIQDFKIANHRLNLTLPLQPNRNHKMTMFGGSLYSASALACYGLFLSGLRGQSFQTNDIVISEGGMRYLAPVDADARIQAQWNSDEEMQKFFQTLKTKKKARVLMRAEVKIQDRLCAEFSGMFVAKIRD
jgi:thioesterase domain-containing protein